MLLFLAIIFIIPADYAYIMEKVPFRRVKADVRHVCLGCDSQIEIGDKYYVQSDDKHKVVPKKFCIGCYEKNLSLRRFFKNP